MTICHKIIIGIIIEQYYSNYFITKKTKNYANRRFFKSLV